MRTAKRTQALKWYHYPIAIIACLVEDYRWNKYARKNGWPWSDEDKKKCDRYAADNFFTRLMP